MSFPRIDGDALQFTAGEQCPINESQSWWLGFDALSLADRELRETDLLLRDQRKVGLRVRRVKGVQDPRELAQDVPVAGWKPINSPFHVSDVPRIISVLGGSKLYGNDWRVPLRELLQNAVDAIQARRRLQGSDDIGVIDVKIREREGAFWLEVSDDGVGMSEQVLTHNLVDFGSSLWRSTVVSREFPGLAARGMDSIGRFGIGFFSVFMIAREVRVTTCRYDHASSDALVLLFNNGVHSRPILAPAEPSDAPPYGGTWIELKLLSDPMGKKGIEFEVESDGSNPSFATYLPENIQAKDLNQLIRQIAPCSDTRIRVTEGGVTSVAVERDDWTTCTPLGLGGRISDSLPKTLTEYLPTLMKPIINADGKTIGRAALWPTRNYKMQFGALVSGGFKVQGLPHLAGVLLGDVNTAVRNAGTFKMDAMAFKNWSTEQAKLASKMALPNETLALMAEVVLELGGDIGRFPIAQRDDDWYNKTELKKYIKNVDEVRLFVGTPTYDEDDEVSVTSFDRGFELDSEVFSLPTLSYSFSPQETVAIGIRPSHLQREFEEVLNASWREWEEYEEFDVIGEVYGNEISRSITIYKRL
ncbi:MULTISPECIES: ATP-binding protein [unclassified Sinorhizobium]|uniref:ATP-binding protein n=1 Tax=unclassified Sinorhizobium TaxID=2613772 RepID=UPI003525DB85